MNLSLFAFHLPGDSSSSLKGVKIGTPGRSLEAEAEAQATE